METQKTNAPTCIGIIMDGNRRWAREHGLPTIDGHAKGYAKAKEAAEWCRDAGVKYMILYAFSNENWNRSPEEVSYLTTIFKKILFEEAEDFRAEHGAICFIGDIARFGEDFATQAKKLEETNPTDPSLTVVIALSYGGRQEILHAVNTIIKEKRTTEVSEAAFEDYLYTNSIPDPDLIIRTSGEHRLSGFLPWQAVYSELFFLPMHWPAIEKRDFDQVLLEYATRERRHGK